MSASKPSRFKIGSEAERPEKIYQDELHDLRIEKLSHRVTLLTILIPCLIGVILVITYLDIKDRVTASQTTGSQGIQALAKDVSSKFSQLSLKEAKLEETITQKLPALEKNTAVIQARLRSAQKAILKTQSVMAEKSQVEQALADINQTLAPLPQKIEAVSGYAQSADDKLSQKIDTLTTSIEALNETTLKIQTELIALSAGKIDEETLDKRMQTERKALQKEWAQSVKKLEKSIKALQQMQAPAPTGSVSGPSTAPPPQQPAPAAKAPPAKEPAPQPAPSAQKPASQPAPPPPGKIIEQDIEN